MTIGERIKRIRIFRKMTQEELGAALGFEGKNQAVRIAQYESNYRTPKDDLIKEIAHILNVNVMALKTTEADSCSDIMESLFWMEEQGFPIVMFEMKPDKPGKPEVHTYDDLSYNMGGEPIGLSFDYTVINSFLKDWYIKKIELRDNIITQDEYFEWKLQWPNV